MESASAFSVYAAKRKNTELLLSGKKKKRNLQKASTKKSRKQKEVKQVEKANQQMGRKESKKSKELNDVNGIKSSKINNVRNMDRKLKLKAMKERRKKCKKNTVNKEAIQMTDKILTRNTETESSESDSNDTNCPSNPSSNASNETNKVWAIPNRNPIQLSRGLFRYLLWPISVETFLKDNWEKTPLYVKRNKPDYYDLYPLSTPILDQVLRDNHVLYGKNIDITSYSNGVRETHNPAGRAFPTVVWDFYENKCSVRMLNPQIFIPAIHALCANLQEYFGCFVGANVYLTPPYSQGFAPHYDDVETFILQIEGQKKWKLYKPLNENEYLPRYSSRNFKQSEIGKPILDTIIKAGEFLYLPRGTIHEAMTLDTHSLHITLSVYQKNSWVDLLEKELPQALKRAAENEYHFRKGLPPDYWKYAGIAHDANDRKDFLKKNIKCLIERLQDHVDIDNAVDLMAKDHIHDFLPPYPLQEERRCTVAEDGEIMTNDGLVKNHAKIKSKTRIRLIRSHCIRLIKEDAQYRLYYSTENSKEYHEYDPNYLEVDEIYVPAIKKIIQSYPNYIFVKELPIEKKNEKIQIVKDLWEKGLIITEEPLCGPTN